MEPSFEQKPAEAKPIRSLGRADERAAVIEDIHVLRQLLKPHEKEFDSRGRSVFARAIQAVIEERQAQLRRLIAGS
jgi:hypothetical protein